MVTHIENRKMGFCRLGNQLFQMAAVIGYARKHKMDYNFEATQYAKYFPKVNFGIPNNSFPVYTEKTHAYQDIPYMDNIMLSGFWQTEKYFEHCKEEIKELFTSPIKFSADKFKGGEGWVGLQNRLGDYKQYSDRFTVLPDSYFEQAMKAMAEKGLTKFLVFSDGMEETKSRINSTKYPDYEFAYSEGLNEFQDLMLGVCCEANIISASSFSWWQAWLSKRPDKLVVAPSKWFPHNDLDTKDVVPDKWIKI